MTEHGSPEDLSGERELAELYQQALTSELAEDSPESEDSVTDALAQRRSLYEYWEKNFGDKVRQWRRERNWSQEDVADRLRKEGFDMHQTTVAKIERGTRPLRVAEAAAIAAIFRVPPLAVFLGPPPTQMPWALNQLHDMVASAQGMLDEMKAEMSRSAGRYVDQEAHVLALARIVNQTALDAEKRQSGQGATDERGVEDDAEA
jgi:transcriptional regulator with XRE-family HTH domain